MNIAMFLYMVGYGLGIATTMLIGSSIGKGDLIQAKSYLRVVQINGVLSFGLSSVLVYFLSESVISKLTSIPEVQDKALEIIPLLVFNTFPELFKAQNKGLVRGHSLQHKAVYIHLSG